jgi:A/G-specific adenine glycosylase
MHVLREAHAAVPASALEEAWADAVQRQRCLDALVDDGLVRRLSRHRFSLPT